MRPVNDIELLKQLEKGQGSSSSRFRPVTDPSLLRKLENDNSSDENKINSYNESLFTPMMNTPASALMQQGIEVGKNPVGRTAEEIVAAIPFGLGEGIGAIGSRLAAKNAPSILQKIADVTGMIGKNAAFGAGSSAVNPNMEGSVAERAASGAEWGGGLGAAGKAIGSGINSLRPSRLLRGTADETSLIDNLRTARGTNTNLGDITESPTGKFLYENLLKYIPFSGTNQKLAQTGDQIIDRGNDIVNKYLGDTKPSDVSKKIADSLINEAEEQRNIKNNLYTSANKIANDTGLSLQLPRFTSTASKYADALNDTTLLKYEPEAKSILGRLAKYANPNETTFKKGSIVDKSGNPLINEPMEKSPSLQEANILSAKLQELAEKNSSSLNIDDRSKGAMFSKLAKALKSDIHTSIDNHGNKELRNEFNKAESNYAKNYSPFLDKDIYKFTNGGRDPQELINEFIKTGSSNDKSNQVNKLMSKLPDDIKDLVKYSYFSRAIEGPEGNRNINPSTLKNIWGDKSLGIEQRKALIPSLRERKILDDYSKLTKMNPDALSLMFNPKTGQRSLLEMALNHSPANLIGKMIGARPLVNKLTDPEYREKLVSAMINKQKLPGGNISMGLAQALRNRLMESN